jgi:hypothetical protein
MARLAELDRDTRKSKVWLAPAPLESFRAFLRLLHGRCPSQIFDSGFSRYLIS